MTLNNFWFQFLGEHQILLIFLGSFLLGESVIITLALLAAQGIISLPFLFLFGVLGTIVSDTAWFYIGKILQSKHFFKKKLHRHHRLFFSVNKITGKKPFLFLLVAKFLYGTRILFITYLSIRKLRYLTFILFDTLGTMVWFAIIISLGWLAGKGIVNFIPIFRSVQYFVAAIIILLIIIKVLTLWFTKKIAKG